MAYLLGMVTGNGEIQRGVNETTVVIEIPHKKIRNGISKGCCHICKSQYYRYKAST